jgi:isopentenyldiphosphate isomerase
MSHDAGQELVDVVDDEGRTINTATRREVRNRHLPHRSTYIMVFNSKGELFIHLRTPTKDVYPSFWDVCVGGVVAAGESFDDAARREAGEELGIKLDPERLFPYLYRDSVWVVHGMAYRIVHGGPFQLQAEEIVRGEFVAVNELATLASQAPFCPDGLRVFLEYQRRFPIAT